jgi:hypothetical protein
MVKTAQAGRYRQGGSGGGDTGELFDDLDYFFASARISTEVYATFLDFKGRALWGRKNVVSGDRRESYAYITSAQPVITANSMSLEIAVILAASLLGMTASVIATSPKDKNSGITLIN